MNNDSLHLNEYNDIGVETDNPKMKNICSDNCRPYS